MLHVILFQPDIAPNTGNVGRLCAVTRSRLHLIHPLGFEITDKHLRRAGMDYWYDLDVHEHPSWEAFCASELAPPPQRTWLFTTAATRSFWDAPFADGDGLLFGKETRGAPEWLHDWAGDRRLRIPQNNPAARSINLATAVGIATYEALRQVGGGPRQGGPG
jgi:tRNA (cytidine/uridine-2'-O-)-methyltransferase